MFRKAFMFPLKLVLFFNSVGWLSSFVFNFFTNSHAKTNERFKKEQAAKWFARPILIGCKISWLEAPLGLRVCM